MTMSQVLNPKKYNLSLKSARNIGTLELKICL